MIKFKIFYGGEVLPADLKANEWSEQHPDAELLDFKYQAVERDGRTVTSICIAYREESNDA